MLKGVNPVAVKVLRDQSYTSREDFSREVALLKSLHNSHIVQFQVRRCREFILRTVVCFHGKSLCSRQRYSLYNVFLSSCR